MKFVQGCALRQEETVPYSTMMSSGLPSAGASAAELLTTVNLYFTQQQPAATATAIKVTRLAPTASPLIMVPQGKLQSVKATDRKLTAILGSVLMGEVCTRSVRCCRLYKQVLQPPGMHPISEGAQPASVRRSPALETRRKSHGSLHPY